MCSWPPVSAGRRSRPRRSGETSALPVESPVASLGTAAAGQTVVSETTVKGTVLDTKGNR